MAAFPPRAEVVAEQGAQLQEQAKAAIHYWLVSRKTLCAKWLASATGVGLSTAYKHADPGDLEHRVTLDDVLAVLRADPERAGADLLDLLGRAYGVDWAPTVEAVSPGSVALAMSHLNRKASQLVSTWIEADEDGEIDKTERADLLDHARKLEHLAKRVIAKVEGMGPRRIIKRAV